LPPIVDYDLYGHCIVCHTRMLTEKFIDGKMVQSLMPEYCEAEYLLDTGSRMRVAMCIYCKNKLTNSTTEIKDIMDTVKRGWEIETNDLVSDTKKPRWTEEHKKEHMARQNKLKIKHRIDGISEGTIKDKIKDIVKDKEKKDKKK